MRPVDNLSPRPSLSRRPGRLLAHLRLQFHGSLAGIEAGWDAPVQGDLDVPQVIPHLLDQLLQEDGDAWSRVGTHSKAKHDPVDKFRFVKLVLCFVRLAIAYSDAFCRGEMPEALGSMWPY